jgi:hypothetical protein
MVRTGLLAALVLTFPTSALAQPDGAGSEVELDEDPIPSGDDDGGADEDPGAPLLGGDPVDDGPRAPAAKKTGYPVREIDRPLTLPDFTSEVRLDVRMFPDPVDIEFGLRARYGITRQIQVGVRYGIGGFYDDGKQAEDKIRFNTGKAVAIEGQYLITDWLAPRVAVQMYVDPFAIGMAIGPAMKFRIGDKLALVGFEDLVAFKLRDKFVPDLDNERANERAATALTTSGFNSDGYVRLEGGVVYQVDDKLAVGGRLGVQFIDFEDADAATGLRVNVQYTPKPMLDLLGNLGFAALDDVNSFSVGGSIAFRI